MYMRQTVELLRSDEEMLINGDASNSWPQCYKVCSLQMN